MVWNISALWVCAFLKVKQKYKRTLLKIRSQWRIPLFKKSCCLFQELFIDRPKIATLWDILHFIIGMSLQAMPSVVFFLASEFAICSSLNALIFFIWVQVWGVFDDSDLTLLDSAPWNTGLQNDICEQVFPKRFNSSNNLWHCCDSWRIFKEYYANIICQIYKNFQGNINV